MYNQVCVLTTSLWLKCGEWIGVKQEEGGGGQREATAGSPGEERSGPRWVVEMKRRRWNRNSDISAASPSPRDFSPGPQRIELFPVSPDASEKKLPSRVGNAKHLLGKMFQMEIKEEWGDSERH